MDKETTLGNINSIKTNSNGILNQLELETEQIKNKTDTILKVNEVTEPKIKNKILLIKKYSNKHKDLFIDFINKYPELHNTKENTIRLKHDIEKYINDFLDILKNKLNISLKYEKILSENGETEFHEALLRIEGIKNFNHIDYLQIHNDFGKSIYIFYNVLNKLFYDISQNTISGKVSLNIEVDDILNDKFLKIIFFLKEKYNIDLSKQKIILELLENYKIPKNNEFKIKITQLKELGFDIALDDNISEKVTVDETIENIDFMGKDMNILKLDGKTIQSFYNVYKTAKELFSDGFNKLKNILNKAKKNGTKIVAEWIENIDMYNFTKNILGVNSFQGFFSEKEENIKILKANK